MTSNQPLPPPCPGDLRAITVCRPNEHMWMRENVCQEFCVRCGMERQR